MTIRKRRNPTPGFGIPPPYQPMTGERAQLMAPGQHPHCAMMQVAAEDTHDNYVICRGLDTRTKRFYDYEEGSETKIGFAVAKPYGKRSAGVYQIGQIFPALLPLSRLGQSPGVAATTQGHPADLDEEVGILYSDEGKVINWLLLDSECQAKRCSAILTADAGPGAAVDVDNVVPLDGGQSPLDDPDDTAETISATMPPAARALDNAVCEIELNVTAGTWKITQVHEQAKAICGTLGGALSTTTASQTISSPVSMDGGQVPSGTVTGYNIKITKGMSGPSGARCIALWNETTNQYEFVYVEGIVQSVVTDWKYDATTHKYQVKTRSLVGSWDGDESDWTDCASGSQPVAQSVVTDVEDATTKLTHDKRDVYVFEAGSETTDDIVTIDAECP